MGVQRESSARSGSLQLRDPTFIRTGGMRTWRGCRVGVWGGAPRRGMGADAPMMTVNLPKSSNHG